MASRLDHGEYHPVAHSCVIAEAKLPLPPPPPSEGRPSSWFPSAPKILAIPTAIW
jgi:hypothetical protein